MELRTPIRPGSTRRKIEVAFSRTDLPVPVIDGKYLHSRYDPVEEARRWAKDAVSKKPCARAVVVLGMGFAYHLKALREQLPAAPVVVLEPLAEIVAQYVRAVGQDIDNVRLWVAPTPQETVDAVAEVVTPALVNDTLILAHPPSLELGADSYRRILASIHSTLDLIAMSLTTGWGFGFEWIEHGLRNVRRLPDLPFVSQFLPASQTPASLVLGAGPSLNENWDIIRRAETLRLVADTALEPMERQGLVPHLGFSLDSQIENARLLDHLDFSRHNLVVTLEVQPSVFERGWRNLIIGSCDDGILTWLERRHSFSAGSMKQGGSVVTCAFDFARQIHSPAIYFGGVDLSFSGAAVYCRGTAYERQAIEIQGRLRSVEQNLYEMRTDREERAVLGRRTQNNLYNYYRWLKDEIGRTESPVFLLGGASLLAEFVPTDGADRILKESFPKSFDPGLYEKKFPPNGVITRAALEESLSALRKGLEDFLTPGHFADADHLDEALRASDIREVIETVTEPAIAVSRYERQKGATSTPILQELRDRLAGLVANC